ncbi:MAG: hypothetical protein KAQ96_08000 [Thermoplasmata archaeon]|nr:hypothetical protein [Thermoplasmata archaeon]
MDLVGFASDEPIYEFPKRFSRRKRMSYIVLPLLFYGALLMGILVGGPDVYGNIGLVMYMTLFLTLVLGFFMLLIYSSRPWVMIYPNKVRVGKVEFPTKYLEAIIVFMDRRLMFERPPYQLIFLADDPALGPIKVTSEAIRNVQDVDTIVRDLRQLLPEVEFVDRTLMGGSAVSQEMLEAMGAQSDE